MTGSDVNRKFKDGVFRTLFNDEEKLLELYNALSNRNYPEGTPIEIVTLDNVIFNEIKNDIAFIIDDRFIILTEHQSTKSPNFPLRMLCYLAKEYEKKYYSDAIYSTRLVTLPTPELYVFYEGKKDAPVEWELKLSDAFREKCDTISVEAVVKVINVSYEKGAELLERCKTMQEFSLFMYMIRKKYDETGNLMTAVSESIYECINSDVLKEYLMEHRGDIMSVLEVNLTIEEREAIRWRDGYEDGREAGAQNERLLIAKNLKIDGIPIDIIAKNTGLTVEEIEEL
ncbi:MAG: hypothetical protein IJA01_08720 [Firmicutes bacterium]|nr:hypothetical protein [Bacillota bacterium]